MQLKAFQTRHSAIETLTKHYIDDKKSTAPYINRALVVA